MNLRNAFQVNKPLVNNDNYKLISFIDENEFNNWIFTSGSHLISIDYVLDSVIKYNSNQKESVMHSNDNGNATYSHYIKVLYQEIK